MSFALSFAPPRPENIGKYLGLLPIIGRGKMQALMEVKQKIAHKLHCWKGKLISQGSSYQISCTGYSSIYYELF